MTSKSNYCYRPTINCQSEYVKKILAILLLAFWLQWLAACNDGAEPLSIPAQHWKDMVVRIETHPNPPLAGMSEIVVIVTGPHGKPAGEFDRFSSWN